MSHLRLRIVFIVFCVCVYVCIYECACFHSVGSYVFQWYFFGVVLDQIRLILMYRVTANIEDEEEDKLFWLRAYSQDLPVTKK